MSPRYSTRCPQVRRYAQLALLCAIAALQSLSVSPAAERATVYAANYDLILTANEATFQATSKARVRSHSAIPVDFGRFRIDMQMATLSRDKVSITLIIHERADGEWLVIETENLAFEADLVSPVEFQWRSANLGIDLALIVSEAPSRVNRDADY